MKVGRWLVLPLLVLGCFALAACGGGSKKSSSGTSTSGKSAASGGAKQGGTIKIGTVGPDSYDPVMFQTVQANSALHLVYTPLLEYKDATGAEGSKLVPGVAESIPTPTNGGKTYTFKIRSGLKYSDGEAVKASDFDNVMKRMM